MIPKSNGKRPQASTRLRIPIKRWLAGFGLGKFLHRRAIGCPILSFGSIVQSADFNPILPVAATNSVPYSDEYSIQVYLQGEGTQISLIRAMLLLFSAQ